MTTPDVVETNLGAMREPTVDELSQAGEGSFLPGQRWSAPAYSTEHVQDRLRWRAVRGGSNRLSAASFLRGAVAPRIGITPGILKKQEGFAVFAVLSQILQRPSRSSPQKASPSSALCRKKTAVPSLFFPLLFAVLVLWIHRFAPAPFSHHDRGTGRGETPPYIQNRRPREHLIADATRKRQLGHRFWFASALGVSINYAFLNIIILMWQLQLL